MKLTVLVDNNTIIDQYFCGEPALSFYIEDGAQTVLFDTGYSDLLLSNAEKLDCPLSRVTDIVLSHGHNDHTGGLPYLLSAGLLKGKRLVSHPDVFTPKRQGTEDIGSPLSAQQLKEHCRLQLTSTPMEISEHLTFLGEIPSITPFESRPSIGRILKESGPEDDHLTEDSAIVWHEKRGLFVITGCSHAGICNIIEYSKSLFPGLPVQGVIGGFHLLENGPQLLATVDYLARAQIPLLYPCHCVSLDAKCRLAKCSPIRELGVGTMIEW